MPALNVLLTSQSATEPLFQEREDMLHTLIDCEAGLDQSLADDPFHRAKVLSINIMIITAR